MVIVTGANGQLGTAVKKLLARQDRRHQAFSRTELDIGNFEAVRQTIQTLKPGLVINCAAYNDVDAAETNSNDALHTNALGPRNLAIVCGEHKIPLVHVSTDYVFDGEGSAPYTIADEPRPVNAYGKTKLLGEKLLGSLTDRFYLVRTSWVFGEGEKCFLRRLLGWAATQKILRVVYNQITAPTSAADLAEAILQLTETGAYGLYHYHNAGFCSRYEWAKFALEKKAWPGTLEAVDITYFPSPARRPLYTVLDLYPLSEMKIKTPTWQEATTKWLEDST
jgi:dTDP-4-dehydrorhamnose reductase